MKKFQILVAALLCLSGLNAQEANSLLWKIEGNGLDQPSYLFGTIHAICPDDLKLSAKVEDALTKVEQIVLEVDMDDPDMMVEMQRLSINPGMENFSANLAAEDLALLDEYFQEHYEADLSDLGSFKPFLLLSMMNMKSLECARPAAFEAVLVGYAKTNEWDLFGLETPSELIAIFDEVEQKQQLEWLVQYAKNEDVYKQEFAKLIEMYKMEDISGLLDLFKEYPEYQLIEEAILDDRNEKWVDPITKFATNKPTFFGVGAAHLAGEKGVINLLKNVGYTVVPVQ